MATETNPRITRQQVSQYETLMPLLEAMAEDFDELAKKKPDGALTKRKVELVNRLLRDVIAILEKEPTAPYLDLLDTETLPQNSDVVLILGQFVAAMNSFSSKYHDYDIVGGHEWRTK